jgi:hypothetical protein
METRLFDSYCGQSTSSLRLIQVFDSLLFEYLGARIIASQPEYWDVQGNIALLPGPANRTLAVTLVTFSLLKLISAFGCDFISESTFARSVETGLLRYIQILRWR